MTWYSHSYSSVRQAMSRSSLARCLVVLVVWQAALLLLSHTYHIALTMTRSSKQPLPRRSFSSTEAEYWKGVNLTAPPPYFPWHKWGSLDSTEVQGMAFRPLLEAMVEMDASPPEYYQYDLLVIRKGVLYRPQTKIDNNGGDRRGSWLRFAIMQRAIAQALVNLYPYRKQNPRIRPLYEQDLPFLVWSGDDTHCSDLTFLGKEFSRLPTLQWCREVTCPYSWPIVSFHLFDVFWHMHTDAWETHMEQEALTYPWREKTKKAFWRGSLTGESTKWKTHNQRVTMVRLAKQRTDIMDVGFVSNDQIPQQDKDEWLHEFQIVEMVERAEQQKFVAIIDIDGNSWSSRLSNQLCLNSVTIKVEPHWEDYFFPELKPWIHYVPIHGNLTDLIDAVEYVLDDKNTAQMQQIVANANTFCKKRITRQSLSIDMLWMLVAYGESFDRYDVDWRQKWMGNQTAYELPSLNMTAVDPYMIIER